MVDSSRVTISKPSRCKRIISWAFPPSLTSLMLTGVFIVTLLLNGGFKPEIQRGFFCNDDTINYPFKKDTVGWRSLFFIAFIFPGLVIKFCDSKFRSLLLDTMNNPEINTRSTKRRRKESDALRDMPLEEEELITGHQESSKRRLVLNDIDDDYEPVVADFDQLVEPNCDRSDNNQNLDDATLFTHIPLDNISQSGASKRKLLERHLTLNFLNRSYGDFQIFFLGATATLLLTGIGKTTCGRLRPHFLHRCQPDVDCSSFSNLNKYIETYNCTNENLKPLEMSYITTSWPSGHASIIFYSMLYLSLYLNTAIPAIVHLSSNRIKKTFNPLLLFTSFVLMIAVACYISLTRVTDFHHHPSDVLSGSIIGVIAAITLFKSLSRKHYDKIIQYFDTLNSNLLGAA